MMTLEDKDQVINNLRRWMEDIDDDELYEQMMDALRRIRKWDPTSGEAMPYEDEIAAWHKQFFEGGFGWLAAAVDEVDAPTPESDPIPPSQPALPATDPDDALEPAFNRAMDMTAGGAYSAAIKEFEAIRIRASGRLARPAEEQKYAAEVALNHQKEPLLANARAASPETAEAAWLEVIAIDPEDAEALSALGGLETRRGIERTQAEINETINAVRVAAESRRLETLNELLGKAQGMRNSNNVAALRLPLDDLVLEATRQRDMLRASLGVASTLMATGNNREAYRRARLMVDEKIPLIVDTAGVMGDPGTEVDTYAFMLKAREAYLNGLRGLAATRRGVAAGEQSAAPGAALATLNEVVAALSDDILTNDDREELRIDLEKVEKDVKSVQQRQQIYDDAQRLVSEAAAPGLAADNKYQLLRQAQEIYPEYPDINALLSAAQIGVATDAAATLESEIAVARASLEKDEFAEARNILRQARSVATTKVPEYGSDSPLAVSLNKVEALEAQIAEAEAAYSKLITRLKVVDDLLDEEDPARRQDALAEARRRLDDLMATGGDRPMIDDRRQRLYGLQGLDSNWTEGRRAYDRGQWQQAIEQLSLVAKSTTHPARKTSGVFLGRAEAALEVERARAAETENRYDNARKGFLIALELFAKHEVDVQTQNAMRAAESAIERLRPFEAGDEHVRDKRQRAMTLLEQAEATTRARKDTPSLLQLNPGYQTASELLQEAATERYTTLGSQVETDLQEVYSRWEDAYAAGMRQAENTKDLDQLKQGIALGDELEARKLLTKQANRELLRVLRIKRLDLEYNQQLNDLSTLPQAIENNRRERLLYTPEIASERRSVEDQLAEAIASRVIAVMNEKRGTIGDDGAVAALRYLSQEMNRPEVYGSKALFLQLMQLLWEEERWNEARDEADKLRYRQLSGAAELRQLWIDLTGAAEQMAANNFNGFKANIEALRQWFLAGNDASSNLTSVTSSRRIPVWFASQNERRDFLADQEAVLKRSRIDRLVRQAGKEQAAGNYLKAAQYYAYARYWEPNHPIVVTGLQQLGQKLDAELNTLLTRADDITLQQSSLDKSADTAHEVLQQLIDIESASEDLGLNAFRPALIDATDKLKKRIDGWERVRKILKEIDAQLKVALRNPLEVRDQGGGWDLSAAISRFTSATQEASKQSEDKNALMAVIRTHREAADRLDADANNLNNEVRHFLSALDTEAFDKVRKQAGVLEEMWSKRQVDGFDGLENLISRRPFSGGQELRSLKAHAAFAQKQEDDLKAWTVWANDTVKAHGEVKAEAEALNKPLDDLRYDESGKSLAELSEACDKAIKLIDKFLETEGKVPPGDPLSRAAEKQRDRVGDEWANALDTRERGEIIKLKADIQADIDKLSGENGPIEQLKSAMTQLKNADEVNKRNRNKKFLKRTKPEGISDILFRNAEVYLKQCSALDPNNSDVVKAKKELASLRDKYKKQRVSAGGE